MMRLRSRAARRAAPVWIVVLTTSVLAQRAPAQTWTSAATSNWTVGSNWDTGVPPTSDAATQLVFPDPLATSYTATNNTNVTPQFVLNRLTFTNEAAVTVANAAGNGLQFAGIAPQIVVDGGGAAPVQAAGGTGQPTTNLATTVGITGAGLGTLTLAGPIDGPGGLDLNRPTASRVSISQANSFQGGVILRNGDLALATSAATLGSGTIDVRTTGAGLAATGRLVVPSSTTLANSITVASGAALTLSAGVGDILNGNVSGGGGLYVGNDITQGSVILHGVASHTGGTTVGAGFSLSLAGPAGAVTGLSVTAVRAALTPGGTGAGLILDSTTADGGNHAAQDRIADTAVITLARAGLLLGGADTTGTTEVVGTVNATGFVPVGVLPGASAGATLTITQLSRVSRGTFEFRGPLTGAAPGTAGVGNILVNQFDAGPATAQLVGGILPSAIGDASISGAGSGLVTYAAGTGVRSLTAGEYATGLSPAGSAGAANNVQVTGTQVVAVPAAANALVLAGTTPAVAAPGGLTGSLTLGSGLVLGSTGSAVAVGTLDFGPREGQLFTSATTSGLMVHSAVTGSNGLTMTATSENAIVGLTNPNNAYTGVTTVNAGVLAVNQESSLGAGGGVVLNGGELRFGGFSGTVSRPLTLGPAGGGLLVASPSATNMSNGTAQTLTYAGDISGSGDLVINGTVGLGSASGGTVVLTGANTFSGMTVVRGGVLRVDDVARLGTHPAMNMPAGTLYFTGAAGTLNKTIAAGSPTFRVDAGAALTATGPITGTSTTTTLTKIGGGSLTLTAASPYAGALAVGGAASTPALNVGGTLRLQGEGALPMVASVTVNSGSELALDNTAANRGNRVANVGVTLAGGTLTLLGSGSAASGETLGALTLPANTGAVVQVTPGAGQTAGLTFNGTFTRNAGATLVVRRPSAGVSGPSPSQVLFNGTTLPAPANGIIPGLFGESNGQVGLMTADTIPASGSSPAAASLRLLRDNEYYPTSVTGAPTTANVRLANSDTSLTTSRTINSLTLNQFPVNVDSGATLTLTSGVLVGLPGNAGLHGVGAINGNLATGGNELLVYTPGAATDVTELGIGVFSDTTKALSKTGGGTLLMSAINNFNTINVHQGTVRMAANTLFSQNTDLTVQAGARFELLGGTATFPTLNGLGDIDMGTDPTTVLKVGVSTGTGPADLGSYGGTITGAGTLQKQDLGVFTLTSTHSFAGPIIVSQGSLAFGAANTSTVAPPVTPVVSGGPVTLFGGTTLTVNNVALFQRDIVLATSGSGNNATLDAGEKFTAGTFGPGGASRLTGTITMPAGRTLTVLGPTTGQFELAGQITGGGGLILGRTATPAGGVVYLSGASDYSGGTTVQLLTALGVGSNTAFGQGPVTFNFAAPVFALNGSRTLANDLTLNAALTAGPDGPYPLIYNLAFTGATTLGTGGGAVTVTGGGALSLNSVTGTPALTKAGVGTLALTGTASYGGKTDVNAGTLLVNGTLDGSGGTVTVAAGAALGGTGTVNRPVVVNAGGTLAPGASPGILTVNAAVNLNAGSVFAAELNGTDNSGATPQFDQLVLGPGGFITLGGATLLPTLGGGYTPSSAGDSLTLISGPYSGTFGNGPNLVVGGFPATVLYNPGAVVLQFSPVPEPAHVLLACGALAGVAGWMRRRRQ